VFIGGKKAFETTDEHRWTPMKETKNLFIVFALFVFWIPRWHLVG
jgi:hypothetical protein